MFKAAIILITLMLIMIANSAIADQSITISLDPTVSTKTKSDGSQLQLRHETLGATRKASQKQSRAQSLASKRASIQQPSTPRVGVITASKAEIKQGPSNRSGKLFVCTKDTSLAVLGQNGAWYGILMSDGSTGWVEKSKVNLLDYQANAKTSQPSAIGSKIVNTALKYLGIRYKWGGYSVNGIDCSGFVKAIFASQGVTLPRVARDQANVGAAVAVKDLQAGDRLYFNCKGGSIDHTGVYMGNGYFIHSSVSRGGVAVDSLSKPLFINSLVTARRS